MKLKKKVTRLQTMDIKAPATDPVPPMRPTNAMQLGSRDEVAALADLMRTATDAEIAAFRAVVERRTTKIPTVWVKCDSPNCGFVAFLPERSVGKSCGKCNWRSLVEGGHTRLMTEAEVREYMRVKAAAHAADQRRAKVAALGVRNLERTAAGLAPLTLDQHQAELTRAYRSQVEQEQRLGESYAQVERNRRAK
jgi:hypothetical protein